MSRRSLTASGAVAIVLADEHDAAGAIKCAAPDRS